jgi:hypothetical protein
MLATVVLAGITFLFPQTGNAVCSVFPRHPCAPAACRVFHRGPCITEFEPPVGQDLRLTIESRNARHAEAPLSDKSIDTIRDMFAALRACWKPPVENEARAGTEMSVRFAFKRTGEIISTPRVSYTTGGTEPEIKQVYRRSITEALERCAPLPFSKGMGGAIAGRPIAIRFVENRQFQEIKEHP